MTTFTWKINNMQVMQSPQPNTAVMSNFTILGNDGDATGSVTYSVNLLPADAKKFTPFDQVTEEMAIQWTKDALGDRVAAMQTEVQKQIDDQAVPAPQAVTLPWKKEEETAAVEE
jgi:hypothetical protein